MKAENTIKIAIITTIIAIIGCFCTKYYLDYKHEEEAKKQAHLERAYELLSIAFHMQESKYYMDFSYVDINSLTLELNAYLLSHPDAPKLMVDDVRDFLSEEYDENDEPRVLNQPENIKKYIAWFFSSAGYQESGAYGNSLERYRNDHEEYKDVDIYTTDIETLNKLIEEFNNDPNREDYMHL